MRALRRAILGLALCAMVATAVTAGLWAVGAFVSDRLPWIQKLSFVPRQLFVWPAGIAWCLFAILSLLYEEIRPRAEGLPWRSERRGRGRLPRLMARMRGVLGVAVLLATLHLVVVEWRWPVNLGTKAPPAGERLRIIHWNVGWSHPVEVMDSLIAREPDLAIVLNPLTRSDLRWAFDDLAQQMGPAAWLRRDWPITVVSRWPVRRWGVTELGFTSRVSVVPELRTSEPPPIDPGHAMFVEVQAGAPLNRTIVVWIVDLPSDPELWRPAVTRQARQRIEAWRGPNGEGFPEPDVLIGDFNIPSGSASLMGLRQRPGYVMADAHAQGGIGSAASWPAHPPILRIDQCFLAPGLRAARYRIEDGGDTRHRMQVVDVVGTGRGQ